MKTKLILLAAIFFIGGEVLAGTIWNKKANFPGDGRHRSTAFSIGNVGYVGLGHHNSGPEGNKYFRDFWAYDPATDSWTQVADYGGQWTYHATDFVYENKGYVGLGQASDCETWCGAYFENDFWEYDPITNFWVEVSPMPASARRGAVAFVLGEFAFVGCGQSATADFLAYHVPTDTWYDCADLPGNARQPVAFSIGPKGYVATGGAGGAEMWEYKPSTDSWIQKADINAGSIWQAHGFALHGKGYVIGGLSSVVPGWDSSELYEYDPTDDSWTLLDEWPALGRRYPDGFVLNDKAYVGVGTNGTNLRDWWEWNPLNALDTPEQMEMEVSTYPNPATEFITFDFGSGIMIYQNVELSIHNLNGQLIYQESINTSKVTVDLYDFSNGTHIYSISNSGKRISSGQFIITK